MVHRKSSSASVGGQKLPRENLQDGEGVGRRMETTIHGQGTSSNGSGAGDNDGGNCGDGSQRFETARVALLRSKQAELDAIEDRHDDLVRFCCLCPLTEGVGGSACAFSLIVCGLCRFARRFILSGGQLW